MNKDALSSKNVSRTLIFWCLSVGICSILFAFHFWLAYPGYLTIDWCNVMMTFKLSDWHPVMYPFLLKRMADVFGYHIYYPLFFNLVPFYLGIFIFIYGYWKKFNSFWCLLGLFPVFIGNIFFSNCILHSSFSSPMFILLLWSIVFYQVLNGVTWLNMMLASIAFLFAVLSRHNALIQVYPIFFIYALFIVKKLKPSHRFLRYILLLILGALVGIIISAGMPRLLKNSESYPAAHIFLHQIAGICLPNNDESCFLSEWYRKGRTFSDVEEVFASRPFLANFMNRGHKRAPFKRPHQKLQSLEYQWIKSIFKYPMDYLKYINQFREKLWRQKFYWSRLRTYTTVNMQNRLRRRGYSDDELLYQASQFKIDTFNFLKNILPIVPIFGFISLNFILFVVVGILFFKKRGIILLYSLSSCTAGISASIIYSIFTPTIDARYIYPVFVSVIIAIIGLLTYIANQYMQNKRSSNDN